MEVPMNSAPMNSAPEGQSLNAMERDHLQRIDLLLREGRSGEFDIRSLDDFARLLANTAPEPDGDMASRIEKRLLDAFQEQKESKLTEETKNYLPLQTLQSSLNRFLAGPVVRVAAFMVLVLVLVTAMSPPLRAVAQEWMGRIGNLLITNEQTQAERDFRQIEQFDTVLPGLPAESVDLAELATRLPFTLLVPSYLPEDASYHTARIVKRESVPNEGVILSYSGPYPLSIEQMPYHGARLEELAVGSDIAFAPTIVKGQPAYWLENVPQGVGGVLNDDGSVTNPSLYYYSMLLWEEDGILYRVIGMGTQPPTSRMDAPTSSTGYEQPGLTLDTALRIADSLAPYQD